MAGTGSMATIVPARMVRMAEREKQPTLAPASTMVHPRRGMNPVNA